MTDADKSDLDQIIHQIDDLLERDQLTTRNGLKFAFTTIRGAMALVSRVQLTLGTIEKKVDTLWMFYRGAMWIAGALGLSIIALIWSLITGQAHITFGSP